MLIINPCYNEIPVKSQNQLTQLKVNRLIFYRHFDTEPDTDTFSQIKSSFTAKLKCALCNHLLALMGTRSRNWHILNPTISELGEIFHKASTEQSESIKFKQIFFSFIKNSKHLLYKGSFIYLFFLTYITFGKTVTIKKWAQKIGSQVFFLIKVLK